MPKIKTSELTGPALDWAVAVAHQLPIKLNPGHGFFVKHPDGWEYFTPSLDWAQGGPIIEREKVCLDCGDGSYQGNNAWEAHLAEHAPVMAQEEITGPTPLIAAMRCFVASKLGDKVDVPGELL